MTDNIVEEIAYFNLFDGHVFNNGKSYNMLIDDNESVCWTQI